MDQQHITVTGGAGFLGSHVVRLLLSEGHRVLALDNLSNGKMAHLNGVKDHPCFHFLQGNVTVASDVEKAVRGSKMIIHLAVLDLRQSIKDPRTVCQVIVQGTLNCLEAARSHGVELFVNCSSSEVYGTAAYTPMNEDHPLRPETPYAAAKVAQDMLVSSYGRTFGLPWVTIRPFNMYGPHSHWQGVRGELIPVMMIRAINDQPLVLFGDGEQTRDFLYVEDAARALLAIAQSPACRNTVINACRGVETSVRLVAEKICRMFDRDPRRYIEFQPPRPGDVRRHIGDCHRLKELTQLEPKVDLDEGLWRTQEWLIGLPYSSLDLLGQVITRNWE